MDENHVEAIFPAKKSLSDLGEAIQIVKIDEEDTHNFILDEEALKNIMDDERIRDKPLCIVSLAGKYHNYFKKRNFFYHKTPKKLKFERSHFL